MSLLDEFEQSTESFIKHGKLYDDEVIKRGLAILPYAIQKAAEEAIRAEKEYKNKENSTKRIFAKLRVDAIRLKEAKNLSSAADRDAWALLNPEYIRAQKEELDAREVFQLTKVKAERLKDNLDVFQKLMTERINSNYLIDRSQKYQP